MKPSLSVVSSTVLALVLVAPVLSAQSSSKSAVLTNAEIEQYARALQMADRRIVDTAVIRSGIASTSRHVRAATALALAQVAPTNREAAAPLLRELSASTSNDEVAANAMFGLGLIRDSLSIATLNVGVGRNGEIGRAAAWALGEIGEPARATIASLLPKRRGRQPIVEAEILLAAAKVYPVDVELVTPYLRDTENVVVRWAAVYALARRRDSIGVKWLLSHARDEPLVRQEVARGLVYYAVRDSDALRKRALEALAYLVEDGYPQVRINAIRSIATFGSLGGDPLRRATDDREASVRVAAAEVAGMVLAGSFTRWDYLQKKDTSFAYQRALVTSSVQAGEPMGEVGRWRTHRDWRYRMASVSVWERAADTVAAKAVGLIATYDEDGRVRGAGYALLAAMDPHGIDPIVQDVLDAGTNDPDLEARESNPNYRRIPTPLDSANAERPVSWYENVVREVVVPSLEGRPRWAQIVTDRGTIHLVMLAEDAPLTVFNFLELAKKGYYQQLRFHRVVPNFVAQDGDPRGDGNGGPGYAIRDELNRNQYRRGAVGMALAGPDTGGSQYFLTLSSQPHLDGHYPLFARIVSGMAVLDVLVQGDQIKSVTVQ